MPIFDYICKHCGHEFETLVLKNAEKIHCPNCKRCSLKKSVSLFSCTGVQLTKRLKMASEEQINKGVEMMRHQKIRKDRIKIL